jgi:hypothetical protein
MSTSNKTAAPEPGGGPMSDYKVGDPVVVYANTRPDGSGQPGEIVKVGRTLLHIRYGGYEQAFRMDTKHSNEVQYGHGTYFRTPEEDALVKRRADAGDFLRKRGIELSNRATFSLEQIEALAEVVRNWED